MPALGVLVSIDKLASLETGSFNQTTSPKVSAVGGSFGKGSFQKSNVSFAQGSVLQIAADRELLAVNGLNLDDITPRLPPVSSSLASDCTLSGVHKATPPRGPRSLKTVASKI